MVNSRLTRNIVGRNGFPHVCEAWNARGIALPWIVQRNMTCNLKGFFDQKEGCVFRSTHYCCVVTPPGSGR
jgi:hypothetical protein